MSTASALALASDPPIAAARVGWPVMGTILDVTVVASDHGQAQQWAEEAVAGARRWDDVLTIWRPEGELARLNAHAGGGRMTISSELVSALQLMIDLSRSTDGAFDPAVGSRVRRIDEVLVLDPHGATLAGGAELDSGAIGKGIALDSMARILRSRGVRAAFLNFGGSSQLAIGAPPGSSLGWRVVATGAEAGSVHGEILLRDASLSTSRAAADGVAEGPIVDPRSGSPVAGPRLATVWTASAATAEAWSTAVVVLGRDGIEKATSAATAVLYDDGGGARLSGNFPLRAV